MATIKKTDKKTTANGKTAKTSAKPKAKTAAKKSPKLNDETEETKKNLKHSEVKKTVKGENVKKTNQRVKKTAAPRTDKKNQAADDTIKKDKAEQNGDPNNLTKKTQMQENDTNKDKVINVETQQEISQKEQPYQAPQSPKTEEAAEPPKQQEEEENKNQKAAPLPSIEVNELITVRDLSIKMNKGVADVLKKLLSLGSLATINQRLDVDTAILLANEFGYEAKLVSIYSEETAEEQKDDEKNLTARAPIVTIMGHVDHGKTSLLDTIRKTNVAEGEYGGITQHIGAYRVKTTDGRFITFLDTPGHEAFTAMRSRGAQVTDIVVLVVSAADGVMPQTLEAINHAKDAGVPIIVAVNKIDLPTADPQKIRQELSGYGLLSEEWGGDTIMVDISAKKQININLLLENILIKAEMMELKTNAERNAQGIVIEAKLDPKKGAVATLLIEKGALKVGDNVVVGTTYGKIRAMIDEHGKRFHLATPSMPVEVLGINTPPQAGDKFVVLDNEYQAREIAESRFQKAKKASLTSKRHLSLADISAGKTKDLRIILKADVQGSLGALCDALERLSTDEILLKIIHRGAGAITESDVDLAVASNALIVGFNLRPSVEVEKLAEDEGVSINVYRIIYDLIADVKAAMEGLLDPDLKEKIIGKAIVKKVFKVSNVGVISGSAVVEGKIVRGSKARLLRDNAIIFESVISSLKRLKDDVKEVEKGFECGIGIEKFADVKQGDIIECFSLEKIARKL
ncbi:MAG: translation initiation factor IF-2 [Elusimicrobiota bacterium]|jgi:translation initiation factor IF-2|nr:translation initiation factor IF-2 [Elusimicrobiota bacterium]